VVRIDWQAVQDEAVEHLRNLVRIDTTNPPGNETAAGRGNVVARLRGSDHGDTGALLLLSHLDVVPAEAERWRYPPFSGALADGYVWGRGALDTKQLTVMELMAVLLLQRRNVPLRRDVVLAATADEEVGGECGLGWLLEEHPDLLACGVPDGGERGVLDATHRPRGDGPRGIPPRRQSYRTAGARGGAAGAIEHAVAPNPAGAQDDAYVAGIDGAGRAIGRGVAGRRG